MVVVKYFSRLAISRENSRGGGSPYFPCGFYEFSFSKWLELPSARSGTITTGLVLVLGGHKIRHCRISNEHGTETETDTCTINS